MTEPLNPDHQDIVDRIIGIVPRLIEHKDTEKAMYAHIVTEQYEHIWRCRAKYPFMDSPDGMIYPDEIECPIKSFDTIEAFINSIGIDKV